MIHFRHQDTARVDSTKAAAFAEQLEDYRLHMNMVAERGDYEEAESSMNVPFDEGIAQSAYTVAEQMRSPNIKYIFVVGIGGSNLGTKAIYDALGGSYDVLAPRSPQIIFVDTNSPELLYNIKKLIIREIDSLDEFVVNAISKSGGTTETMFNTEAVMGMLQDKFGDRVRTRLVVTTGEGSPFWNHAHELGITLLPLPERVGGRYSVLTTVGLLPLALGNIDVESLRNGAKNMREACLADSDDNIARASAIAIFAQYQKQISIHDSFIFSPHLMSCGLWYRQLMGESVGKEENLNGEKIYAGITPTVSVGSTDLHSVGQLYLGGPKDKITTFIWSDSDTCDVPMPSVRLFPNIVEMATGKSATDIMSAILEGTKIAYQKQELPYMEVVFDEVNEYTIGEFLQFKMMEMMYLGSLMHVNTFDQPNVEMYKTETKRILEEN